ncbi:hypothetical protein EEI76_23115 (plasmid) [Enterobacter cloacae]|nr:hypothetical protein EEI76_23115 [Enterobacter cloacae]
MAVIAATRSLPQAGDILYPVRDAIYVINKNENQRLKVTSASAFSATHWRFLKGYTKIGRNILPWRKIWVDPK